MSEDLRPATTVLPDGTVVYADGTQLLPDGTTVLPDGTRLKASVDDAEIGMSLPAAAFEFPPHRGYRPVDAAEARRLLGGR